MLKSLAFLCVPDICHMTIYKNIALICPRGIILMETNCLSGNSFSVLKSTEPGKCVNLAKRLRPIYEHTVC